MCELYVTCDVCMLNHVRSWLYVVGWFKILHDFVDYRNYMGSSMTV
jgi:hypothetical protein